MSPRRKPGLLAPLALLFFVSACGTASPSAHASGSGVSQSASASVLPTLDEATTLLKSAATGWTVKVVPLTPGGFEAAAYDSSGHLDLWTFSNGRWSRSAQSGYPWGANGYVQGPGQRLFPNEAPTGVDGGIVNGMGHATFVLAMPPWSDPTQPTSPYTILYSSTSTGVFGVVQNDLGSNPRLIPGGPAPGGTYPAMHSASAMVARGELLTPGEGAYAAWQWDGSEFVPIPQTQATPSPTPVTAPAPCSGWGLPAGSKTTVLYCQSGWAVVGYQAPGVPSGQTFRAHWINGRWQAVDSMCRPGSGAPSAWIAACQVG